MLNPLIQQLHLTSRLTVVITSPQCMAMSPQQCVTSQPPSITPQQSLAMNDSNLDIPTPSSSDEDSNPLPVEELENVKKCCN